jgi:hypothetical protein
VAERAEQTSFEPVKSDEELTSGQTTEVATSAAVTTVNAPATLNTAENGFYSTTESTTFPSKETVPLSTTTPTSTTSTTASTNNTATTSTTSTTTTSTTTTTTTTVKIIRLVFYCDLICKPP